MAGRSLSENSERRIVWAVIEYAHVGDITHGTFDTLPEADAKAKRLEDHYPRAMFGIKRLRERPNIGLAVKHYEEADA